MNEEKLHFDTPEEYAEYLAMRTRYLRERLVNAKVSLRMLQQVCGEPLLDVILEYLDATHDVALDASVVADNLQSSLPRLDKETGRFEND